MKTGKVPENILRRSVFRQIRTKGKESGIGAGVGNDCAVFPSAGDEVMVSCMQEAVVLPGKPVLKSGNESAEELTGEAAAELTEAKAAGPRMEAFMTMGDLIQKCANNLAAGGARPAAVMVTLLLPEGAEEEVLRDLMGEAGEKCAALSMEIIGGQSRVTGAVALPVAVVAGFGRPMERRCNPEDNDREAFPMAATGERAAEGKPEAVQNAAAAGVGVKPGILQKAAPGQDIVLSKWIGLQGTAILAKRNRKKLLGRYPAYLVEEAEGFGRYLSVLPEAEIAVKCGVCAMHDASEGGILGALWELAESAGVGLEVDMRKLPLRQETVEVCECCSVNPYELMAGGCLIMTCRDGLALAAALEAAGIPAEIVGKVTESSGRILFNGDEVRYMNRPEPDGIWR